MEQLALSDPARNTRSTGTVANPPVAHLSGKHCVACHRLLTVHQAAVHESPVPQLAAAACATCRGYCCRTGGTRAHLDAATLRSYRLRNPDTGKSDLLRRYLEYLPAKSYADLCVFHTASGCALPREMRSSTCNEYACDGLRELRALHGECASAKVLLVAAHPGEWVRSALALPDGRRVTVPRTRTEVR